VHLHGRDVDRTDESPDRRRVSTLLGGKADAASLSCGRDIGTSPFSWSPPSFDRGMLGPITHTVLLIRAEVKGLVGRLRPRRDIARLHRVPDRIDGEQALPPNVEALAPARKCRPSSSAASSGSLRRVA